MKIFKLLITLQTLIFFSIGYAMEQEKPAPSQEEELFFELFTQLPLDIQQTIIVTAAKVSDLEKVVKTFKNLRLVNTNFKKFIDSDRGVQLIVEAFLENKHLDISNIKDILQLANINKKFKEFIHSQKGTEIILKKLLKNENIQNFFDRVAAEFKKRKNILIAMHLDASKIRELMELKENIRKIILLTLLPTQAAQQMIKEQFSTEEWKKNITYGIWLQLIALLKFFALDKERFLKKDPSLALFLRNLILVTWFVQKTAKRLNPLPFGLELTIEESYPEYMPMLNELKKSS